ncbi:hypothetical protein ACFZCL_18355 [Streptomyces sp. NPDC008159]|uniref:hypothetical protein n=1 Tax=Streptomyces sp. NPDC008159 TaxID=3364817 RepID=UPI0036E4EF3F
MPRVGRTPQSARHEVVFRTDLLLEEPISTYVSARPPLAALSSLTTRPMPDGVRGALVHHVSATPDGPFLTCWMAADHPNRVPPGRILLSWNPAPDSGMDVTARLGLPGAEVLLATWPQLAGDWSRTVHPTVVEVMGLHSALTLATAVLELLAD